jgi:hypothetical protein
MIFIGNRNFTYCYNINILYRVGKIYIRYFHRTLNERGALLPPKITLKMCKLSMRSWFRAVMSAIFQSRKKKIFNLFVSRTNQVNYNYNINTFPLSIGFLSYRNNNLTNVHILFQKRSTTLSFMYALCESVLTTLSSI